MKEGHTRVPAHVPFLLALMMLFWALNFTIAKFALREIPPALTASLRFLIAGVVVWPLYWWKQRGRAPVWNRRSLTELLGLGLVGIGLNQFLFVFGISRTSVGHASLTIALSPVLVLVMAAMAGQERITAKKLAGLAVAIAGVGVLQVSRGGGSGASLAGDVLVFLSGLAFAVFSVFGRHLVRRYDSLTVNTFAYVGCGIALFPAVVWSAGSFPYAEVSAVAWASLAYMAVFPALICYMIYYYALSYIPASKIAALGYLQPVMATGIAVGMLGETLTMALAGGGLLILLGVLVAERA